MKRVTSVVTTQRVLTFSSPSRFSASPAR
jgi:hypothetical protein